jgi:hypothetical protein
MSRRKSTASFCALSISVFIFQLPPMIGFRLVPWPTKSESLREIDKATQPLD